MKGVVMDEHTKEVYFNVYCETCAFSEVFDWMDPCDECLSNPSNIDSHKPVEYKEKTKQRENYE